MSRKNKPAKTMKAAPAGAAPLFSKGGKLLIALGVFLVGLGLFLLCFTDAIVRHWASTASPLCIVLGYGFVFLGIFWPLEGEEDASSSSPAAAVSPGS